MRATPNSAATTTVIGAPTATAPLDPVAEGEDPDPLRVPEAPPLAPAPDADPPVAVAVATTGKSWVDANVWQLLEAGIEGVYGGVPTGPTVGWNQVVVAPGAVVNTPGGVMSSLSQTWKVPLIWEYWMNTRLVVYNLRIHRAYISQGIVSAATACMLVYVVCYNGFQLTLRRRCGCKAEERWGLAGCTSSCRRHRRL